MRHPPALGNCFCSIYIIPVLEDRRDLVLVREDAQVGKRIAVDDQDVRARAAFERSGIARPAERLSIAAGRGLDRFHRTHSDELYHQLESAHVPIAVSSS